jgi:hypothetical protein
VEEDTNDGSQTDTKIMLPISTIDLSDRNEVRQTDRQTDRRTEDPQLEILKDVFRKREAETDRLTRQTETIEKKKTDTDRNEQIDGSTDDSLCIQFCFSGGKKEDMPRVCLYTCIEAASESRSNRPCKQMNHSTLHTCYMQQVEETKKESAATSDLYGYIHTYIHRYILSVINGCTWTVTVTDVHTHVYVHMCTYTYVGS